eukprot:12884975-Prorocentrum_lima.AAC.1
MHEGTYFVGQGHYILVVLERFSSSMHNKTRNTPGEPEPFFQQQQAGGDFVQEQIQHLRRAW